MAKAREPLSQRIQRNHKKVSECWIWTGCVGKDGYGVLGVGRKQMRAHRASFEAFSGEIPGGLLVCHRCDQPLCVNPDHLFLGTPRDNTQDMIRKSRRKTLRGESHPNSKITMKDRETIRLLRSSGAKLSEVAEKFGIAIQTVSAIANGDRNYGTRN